MSKHGRVLVAMSGGVDSSAAAVMLQEEGYEVIGVTMKVWSDDGLTERAGRNNMCCSLESVNDARSVALRHGFPHFFVDVRESFDEHVIGRFSSEYLAGRTPNPCILCNTYIKWEVLIDKANELRCQYFATGHYARIRCDEVIQRYVLMKGKDQGKDQSYAMWGLTQDQLARTIFPLGTYHKPEIRQLASEFGLFRIADKPDSYEICFIPGNDYRQFLQERITGLKERVNGGKYVLRDGTVIGTHRGYPFYTIGQRHGLGLALGYPVFVTSIDAKTNTITVGPVEELFQTSLTARQANMIKVMDLYSERDAVGKVRYKDKGGNVRVRQTTQNELLVTFDEPRRAISPGQAVVLYEGEDVLAGGWIDTVGIKD